MLIAVENIGQGQEKDFITIENLEKKEANDEINKRNGKILNVEETTSKNNDRYL